MGLARKLREVMWVKSLQEFISENNSSTGILVFVES
jgi:hypothetical protein